MNYERKAMFTSAFIVQSSAFNDSLAAALLDGLFEHPASMYSSMPKMLSLEVLADQLGFSAAC
ncbi:MAG: hypothetical protein ABL935_09455 [Nitrospiraceae bacterium]